MDAINFLRKKGVHISQELQDEYYDYLRFSVKELSKRNEILIEVGRWHIEYDPLEHYMELHPHPCPVIKSSHK